MESEDATQWERELCNLDSFSESIRHIVLDHLLSQEELPDWNDFDPENPSEEVRELIRSRFEKVDGTPLRRAPEQPAEGELPVGGHKKRKVHPSAPDSM
jgi:hypothetical protein